MATLATPVIRERCHYCSRWKSSTEIIHLSGGAAMCWQCHEWHSKAIQHLEAPTGCQECGATLDQLRQLDPNGNVPMTVVCKDGIYEFLCKPCADAYIRKRVDLFGDTEFGHMNKLKGSH